MRSSIRLARQRCASSAGSLRPIGAPRALKPETFTVRSIDYDERRSAAGPRPVGVTNYQLASAAKHPGYVLSCQLPEGAPPSVFVNYGDVMTAIGAFFTDDTVH
ncbi:MAG: hypothetical protein HC807_04645 [Gammaproteobacteria bacterium]|nr:hypothetical protein [Gammaproteobacteria bacterium]